ncbi:NADH dehydrogenase [ubiquinone] 1 alpha subcomplex subunit 4-like 2 [Teleopsis dalmanni]|uniref:NADH dehydrogenase [ubiquinone] 1 alpha subcomplex subunit 4-like 2 n=1 Tax=Teleopsis dalmanni TaxID=139649 RepID=UPI0018CFA34E|nr:NADH dehydrogenase [ubiquinone] 1 alpha subcomplex subunit 4-like 2 [Teleopsis dalmanni]
MEGLTFRSIMRHPSLIPLYMCVVGGLGSAAYYSHRVATKSPDIIWDRKKNPEPWQEYKDKQYKMYSPIRDYSKIECKAPQF